MIDVGSTTSPSDVECHESIFGIGLLRRDFTDTDGFTNKLLAARNLEAYGTLESHQAAAAAYLELATTHPMPGSEQQHYFFSSAYNLADTVVSRADRDNRLTSTPFEAQQLKIDIPILVGIHAEGQIPKADELTDHFFMTLRNAELARDCLLKNGVTNNKDRREIAGILGEEAVMLLLEGYEIFSVGGNNRACVKSSISDDRSTKGGDKAHGSLFDLNVYDQLDPTVPVTSQYKIQVGGASKLKELGRYDSDIRVVTPWTIQLPGEEAPSFLRVVREIGQALRNPESKPARNVSARTELLLDALDCRAA